MHIRCPHCSHRLEVIDDDPLVEVYCPTCGSSFAFASGNDETVPQDPIQRIGHFDLVRQVGHGTFGSVWKARDNELDRFVAVKLPRREHLSDSDAGLFLREARAAAQLRHPNLVAIHEVGKKESGQLYIVSDFIEGANLAERLQVKPLSIGESVELVIVLCEAIQHAHDHGVIHRDLKPQNILIDAAGTPHIADFGLAKRNAGDITMTAEGKIIGTPAYMSPEQAAGKGNWVDARSDVYSLGVILFQLLTNELPFRGSQQMLLMQILNDDPPSPRKFNALVKRDLETICLKCMAKERDRRYNRAADLAVDLNRFLQGSPINARPVGKAERAVRWCRRNSAVASLVAGVVALLLMMVTGSILYSLRVRQHADEAESYFRMSRDAVDSMLAEVESLADIPNAEPVRRSLLSKALELQKELIAFNPLNDALRLEVARAQYRSGDIYELLGLYDDSRLAYEEAISMFEQLLSVSPEDFRTQFYLAICHNEFGELLRVTSPGDAEKHYRIAEATQKKLHRLHPSNADNLRELNRTRNNLGLLLTETSRFEEAETELVSGIQSLKELIPGLPPESKIHKECSGDLARMNINLGVLLRMQSGRVSAAESSYRDAISVLDELVAKYPNDAEHRLKLGLATLNLGNLVLKSGNASTALEWFDRSRSQLSDLRNDFPGVPSYRRELANSLNSSTAALFALRDFEQASARLEDANRLLDQLALDFAEYYDQVADGSHLKGVVLGGLGQLALEIDQDAQRADRLLAEAIDNQRRAVARSPQNTKYLVSLIGHLRYRAKILRELGLDDEAMTMEFAAREVVPGSIEQ